MRSGSLAGRSMLPRPDSDAELESRSSKDAVIRVWNRKTEELHRTLRGHEGPVNAVGLEGGRVVGLPCYR